MKCPLHFATIKLNFRDIQKCNVFWVPPYDLDLPIKNSQIFPCNIVISTWRSFIEFIHEVNYLLINTVLFRDESSVFKIPYFFFLLEFFCRSFLRLQLRAAKGFPKAKEKPGQDPYDGKLLIGSIHSQSSCSHSALRLVYLAPVVKHYPLDESQNRG